MLRAKFLMKICSQAPLLTVCLWSSCFSFFHAQVHVVLQPLHLFTLNDAAVAACCVPNANLSI